MTAGTVPLARELRHPLAGHIPIFRRDRLTLLDACVAEPGPVVELRLARRAYLLKRAEDVQHVLVPRYDLYPKSPRNVGPRATRILGYGLITSTGEAHRRMKRRARPVFRRHSLGRTGHVVLRAVDATIDRWEDRGEIDIADEMNDLALQAMICAICGVESGPDFTALAEGTMTRRHSLGRAFNWPFTEPAVLPLALRRGERRAIRRLDETLDRLIRERRNGRGASGDLLSTMMETHDGGRSAADARQVRGEALNLLLAAHGNVARVLTYTLIALADHPHVEARLRDEVERVLGDRAPAAEDCAALPYTDMVLSESMRRWPPNALIFRDAREDDVLPSGTHVRAGDKVMLSPYVVQLDPAYYPEPRRFDPERFSPEARRARPTYAYFPFGGGPRVCIGQTLATMVATLAVARVLQRVRLDLPGEAPPYVCGRLPPGAGPIMRVSMLTRRITGDTDARA